MWSRREFRFDQFRRQMFERGDLKYVILEQLKDKPAHGYELIKALEERFGGFYAPSPGAVYPTLQMLEDMGYVSSVQQDGRKTYSITDAGRAFMTERQPQVDEVFSRMKERWGAEWGPQAHRVMHELRNDLRDLGRSVASEARHRWPDPEQQRRIRDVIGRAKAEIQAILSEQPAAKV
ncbi:MAG: PadR family transcriptional regulator [Chloroflexi bacterium]|jgi:DNA-binding PadR family transcriptional regulator|nr:MAG: PadR family transcriptional regulator [Chloroflexota bacterium]TMD47651.1 MAG: PadR family transcriptional regulator [Chloroflexota bacterium]